MIPRKAVIESRNSPFAPDVVVRTAIGLIGANGYVLQKRKCNCQYFLSRSGFRFGFCRAGWQYGHAHTVSDDNMHLQQFSVPSRYGKQHVSFDLITSRYGS